MEVNRALMESYVPNCLSFVSFGLVSAGLVCSIFGFFSTHLLERTERPERPEMSNFRFDAKLITDDEEEDNECCNGNFGFGFIGRF
jgi:hypothetical protein